MPRPNRRHRRTFGAVRKLPSGRYQARYWGPDGVQRLAPETFATRGDADAWLADVPQLLTPPADPPADRPAAAAAAAGGGVARPGRSTCTTC